MAFQEELEYETIKMQQFYEHQMATINLRVSQRRNQRLKTAAAYVLKDILRIPRSRNLDILNSMPSAD